jgi:hypothetical protein
LPSGSASPSSPPSHARRARAAGWLALALTSALAGCSLIKINGKPLSAYGSSARSSGSPSSASSAAEAADEQLGPRVIDAAKEQDKRCGALNGSYNDEPMSRWTADLKSAVERGMPDAAASFLNALCATDGEVAQQRKEVERLRGLWMTKHHLDERDYFYLADSAHNLAVGQQKLETFDGIVGQYKRLSQSTERDHLRRLDEGGVGAPAMIMVALVDQCLSSFKLYTSVSSTDLPQLILCTRLPIDLTRAFREIDQDPNVNVRSRYDLRQAAVGAWETQAQAAKTVQASAKAEPGIARMLEIADEELKRWRTLEAATAKRLERLRAMEAAAASNKRSAFAGCEEATVADWLAHLATVKMPDAPKSNELDTYLGAALATADGYLSLAALLRCTAGVRHTQPATWIIREQWIRRGPLSAITADWTNLRETIEFDDRSYDRLISAPEPRSDPGVRSGTIAKLSPVGGSVEVTFQVEREQHEVCTREVNTGRIASVSEGGTVNYEYKCLASGKKTFERTPVSVTVPAALAQGLRSGMYFVALDGLPIVATSSANSKKPLSVLGYSLR